MSRFVEIISGKHIEEIDSLEICKWRINEVCCNDNSEYLADYPFPNCKCESKKDCIYFEQETEI